MISSVQVDGFKQGTDGLDIIDSMDVTADAVVFIAEKKAQYLALHPEATAFRLHFHDGQGCKVLEITV